MRDVVITALFSFVLVLVSSTAEARSGRQNQVPNGGNFGCDVCHTQPGNGLNDFGFDSYTYTSGGQVGWNAEFANRDSDRDGYTNGEELGDPTGSWRGGQGNPGGFTSNPGDRGDTLCGNGSYEGEEECEGNDLGGATCEGLGLRGGTLSCGSDCKYDTSACQSCGDGTVQDGEDCDGGNLNGANCSTVGAGEGVLSCNGCRFDTTGCATEEEATTPDSCGNGLLEANEQCDVSALGGQTCATLGYTGGTLGCAVRCTYDVSACTGAAPSSTPDDSPASGNETPTYPGAGQDPGSDTDGDPMKVVAEGRACSTAISTPTPTPLLVLLAFLVAGLRRRRE